MTIQERLEKYKFVKDGHWLWIGVTLPSGHGIINYKGNKIFVSRLIAYLYHGLDLDNKNQLALHKVTCPYPSCFNPDCIYIGSDSDNKRDSHKVGRGKPGPKSVMYCKRKHPLFGENLRIKKNGTKECIACRKIRDWNRTHIS